MSDFATALRRIRLHGDGLLSDAAEMLRHLVADTCEAISAMEGSILVPTDDQTELRFLVSMNPTLASSSVKVPVDGSISGYVFSSRQAMAKVHPDSPGATQVDRLSQTETNYLLAVPIVDDDRVYGVATFVNRTGDLGETPFSVSDLRTAEGFGEIYATAMKLYRKIEFSTGMAKLEIAEHAREFDLNELEEAGEVGEAVMKLRLPALVAEKAMDLPAKEGEMLMRFAEMLEEFAANGDERREFNEDGTADNDF